MDPISVLLGTWSQELTLGAVALRLGVAILCGAIAGCERAEKRHAAGLRTFILVTLAGAVCMMLDVYLGSRYLISAAAVIGVAILSVNSVLYSSKSQIKGLTTSVGLWVCVAIGLAAGAGMYTVAVFGFAALPEGTKVSVSDMVFNPLSDVMNGTMTPEQWAAGVEEAIAEVNAAR